MKYPPMDAAEYQRAVDALGMSGNEFAELIGISTRHAKRYRAGSHQIPPVVARFIRTILRNELEPDQIG